MTLKLETPRALADCVGRDLGGTLRPPARQAGGHIALVPAPSLEWHPEARHDHRHGRTRVSRGDLGDALQAVASQHGAHHFQMGAARRYVGYGSQAFRSQCSTLRASCRRR